MTLSWNCKLYLHSKQCFSLNCIYIWSDSGGADGDYGKAPQATLWCQPKFFLPSYLSASLNVLQWACITFYIRKRLKKTLFHKRKKGLCVGMNGHSVLLRLVGGWRGPLGTEPGPLHTTPSHPRPALSLASASFSSSSFWHVRPAHHQAASGPSSQPCSSLGHEALSHILTQSPFARAIWWPRATPLRLMVTLVPRSKDCLLIVAVASRWQRRVFPVVKLVFKAAVTFLVSQFLFWGILLTILLTISYLRPKKSAKARTIFQKLSKVHGAFSPISPKTGGIKYHFPLLLPSPSLSVASYLESFNKGGRSSCCRKLMS